MEPYNQSNSCRYIGYRYAFFRYKDKGRHLIVGKFVSDIVLQILSFVAENERTAIKQGQKEGIAATKLRGTKFGRPAKVYDEEFKSIVKQYKSKKLSLPDALTLSGLNRCNFYYHMRKLENITD